MNDENFDRFMDELEYAYEAVPFYKKHLDKAGVIPEDIESLEDIPKVPATEKKDYRKNFPIGVIAKGYKLSDGNLVKSQSSGTSGERLITFEVGMLLMDRAVTCTSIREAIEDAFTKVPRKICRYAAPNCSDVECANPNSTTEDRMLSDGTLVLPVYHDLLTTSEKLVRRALDEICSYEPDLYYVDPTHFAFLLREANKYGYKLPNAPIVATYTATTPLNKKQIIDAFKGFGHQEVVFSQLVSSSEMGWIALECDEGHLHFNEDSYFMELIADDYAEIGEVGELYITSLDNGAIPHVRYKTGDTFTYLGEACDCGLGSRIVEWAGRVTDHIHISESEVVRPNQIYYAIGAPTWLDLYQLVQQKKQQFDLFVMVNETYGKGDEESMLASLKEILGNKVSINFEVVPYISTERSGKFQCVKSKLEQEE